MLREPGKAEAHIASLRGPGPLAGGDDLCLLRAGHGSVKRGHKTEQGEQEREKEREHLFCIYVTEGKGLMLYRGGERCEN